jgi:hypothetical protein
VVIRWVNAPTRRLHPASHCFQGASSLRGTQGETWPDVSSWYWSALTAPAGSSWWSFVVVERER